MPAAAIFILDLYTPLGLALGILYLIPLALTSLRFGDRPLFTVAALGTGLTVLGFFLSPPGVSMTYTLFNRTMDITLIWLAAWFLAARRRTETVLKEHEERLQIAQFNSRTGILDWDLRTNRLTWTPELEQMYGLTPGTVRSYEDFRQHVHPDDLPRVEAQRDDAIRSRRTFEIEFRIIRPSGEIRRIESRGSASYDKAGEPVHILGNNCDITARKQAEAHRQALLDAAPDATVTIDRAGKIAHVNRQMEQVFGYHPDELLGQPIEILIPARFHQSHQARGWASPWCTAASGRAAARSGWTANRTAAPRSRCAFQQPGIRSR